MADLNRNRLLLVLASVLTLAVGFQAYELSSIRDELREATTVLRAMAGKSAPIGRPATTEGPSAPTGAPSVTATPAPRAKPAPVSVRVTSPVRDGQLPPTVDQTYTPKSPGKPASRRDPCVSGCRAVLDCGLKDGRCPRLDTKIDGVLSEACAKACRNDPQLGDRLQGSDPCGEGLGALQKALPALEKVCAHRESGKK
jgi:hypothetical protein